MNKKKKTKLTDTLKTKTDFKSIPPLKEDLINSLDERFPEQSADMQWNDREVWFKAGQRSVIKFLLKEYQEQKEDVFRS
tara:strand:- start:336 stop:572 length:237 start_codon:yes stop_codon:yes gene_type:complete